MKCEGKIDGLKKRRVNIQCSVPAPTEFLSLFHFHKIFVLRKFYNAVTGEVV